jgi:DNA-binding NarL/FixJ family response regulator
MSAFAQGRSGPSRIPTRILVTGSDLLAGALASALKLYGFATMQIEPSGPEIERGIEWRPDLVLFDAQPLDIAKGSTFVEHLCRTAVQVCVIDAAGDEARRAAWLRIGSSEIIDRNEPFEQLFRTINRLLKVGLRPLADQPASASLTPTDGPWQDSSSQLFANLTEREEVVLAELLEGHCAEEIAKAAFVSISTIRSQIKSILQKLGVNSQLAAVALARRAGWTLDTPRDTRPKPSNARRNRAS